MHSLTDSFDRKFSYLRVSVTDACNFRCVYCLPNGHHKEKEAEPYLTVDEIRRLVTAFAEVGFWKFRITGGEPTLRRDILDILSTTARVPGVRKLTLSTNGYRLKQMAGEFLKAGVSQLNVSVDSLDSRRFHQITGQDRLGDVLEGIFTALALGFEAVKVNVVLMKGLTDSEIDDFISWVADVPVCVRFIELMQTGENRALFDFRHLSSSALQLKLVRLGWKRLERTEGAGPAVEFSSPGYRGTIGIIAPYSRDFCSTCNRLRINSRGGLRLCLFGDGDYSLRHLLQAENDKERLKEIISALILEKKVSHSLQDGLVGRTSNFATIGG